MTIPSSLIELKKETIMYTFNSRVRYSEVDQNLNLDLTSIINYFQDCSTFHGEDSGNKIAALQEKKRVWVMNAWQIVIHKIPSLGDEITITTWPYDFKAMYGYRNFLLSNKEGDTLITANSIWVYVNTENYKPVRVSEEDITGFALEPAYDMDYATRKITLPTDCKEYDSFQVVRSNLDMNNHVNNGQYIKMAQEFIPENCQVQQIRAEYRMSAVLGDIIFPLVSIEDNICTVVLADTKGKPFTIVEFLFH